MDVFFALLSDESSLPVFNTTYVTERGIELIFFPTTCSILPYIGKLHSTSCLVQLFENSKPVVRFDAENIACFPL